MLLLNKDICSEYRNVVQTFARTDANYPCMMPDNFYAAAPFSGPMPMVSAQLYSRNVSHSQFLNASAAAQKQHYPYQPQTFPQWNYMYYSPISPQPPTVAASLLYAAPTAIPAGVPMNPQHRLSTSADGNGIKYRKPCEFRQPQEHHPSAAALPVEAQDSIAPSLESAPALVAAAAAAAAAAAEKALIDNASASVPPSEESYQDNDTTIGCAASNHPDTVS